MYFQGQQFVTISNKKISLELCRTNCPYFYKSFGLANSFQKYHTVLVNISLINKIPKEAFKKLESFFDVEIDFAVRRKTIYWYWEAGRLYK